MSVSIGRDERERRHIGRSHDSDINIEVPYTTVRVRDFKEYPYRLSDECSASVVSMRHEVESFGFESLVIDEYGAMCTDCFARLTDAARFNRQPLPAVDAGVPLIGQAFWNRSRSGCLFIEHIRYRDRFVHEVINRHSVAVNSTIEGERYLFRSAGHPIKGVRSEAASAPYNSAIEGPSRSAGGLCAAIGNNQIFTAAVERRCLYRVAVHRHDERRREERHLILHIYSLQRYLIGALVEVCLRHKEARSVDIGIVRQVCSLCIAAVLRTKEIGVAALAFHAQVIAHKCCRSMVIHSRVPRNPHTFLCHFGSNACRCSRTCISLCNNGINSIKYHKAMVRRCRIVIPQLISACIRNEERMLYHTLSTHIPYIRALGITTDSGVVNSSHDVRIAVVIQVGYKHFDSVQHIAIWQGLCRRKGLIGVVPQHIETICRYVRIIVRKHDILISVTVEVHETRSEHTTHSGCHSRSERYILLCKMSVATVVEHIERAASRHTAPFHTGDVHVSVMVEIGDKCLTLLVNDGVEQLGIAVDDERLVVNILIFANVHEPVVFTFTVESVGQAIVAEVLTKVIVLGVTHLNLQCVIVLTLCQFRQRSMVQHH